MKNFLRFGFGLIILFAMGQWAMTQMPAAITIEPANATGWDEITLTLDADLACVPDGKQPVTAASTVRMHSAAFLYDNIDNWGSEWGDPGIDYDAQPKQEGFDYPTLTDNGDGTYSITFIPGKFYGVAEGSTIIGITAVFNGGSWDYEAKDDADDGCGDFYIPLSYDDPTPALKFVLDLTYQEELGNFDRADGKAYVIVNDTEYEMEQLFVGIVPDARYDLTLTEADDGITAETSYSYKFKMDETEETVERDPVVAKNYQITLSHFFNDEEKPVEAGDIKFIVDMRYQAREGMFDPAEDTVDIAGSMNGWDGAESQLTDVDSDTIYEILFEGLDLGNRHEYKYRINGNWDTSEFPGGGPNRHATVITGSRDAKSVYNNYVPGYVPVTLSVNMGREIALGNFDPAKDYVDVPGSLNGWGGDWNDELFNKDGDSIYVTHPPAFAPVGGEGDTMEYKFRLNSNWDTAEFPGGGPNRKYVVVDTTGGVVNAPEVVWYNDMPLGMIPRTIAFEEVKFYPNPVNDIMYIENNVDMMELRISNILGQDVMRLTLDNQRSYELSTGELERGLYILSVFGKDGYVGTAKFLKQ